MKTRSPLPGKRFFTLFACILFLVGITLLIQYLNGNTEGSPLITLVDSAGSTDSDKDGLPDIEEQLWQTDPNNKDTDSDGTNDGEEVREGRHPRYPAPDDQVSDTHKKLIYSSSASSTLTITDRAISNTLSQALILAASKIDGAEVSEDDIELLIDQVVLEDDPTPYESFYNKSSVSLTSNTKVSYQQYIEGIVTTIDTYSKKMGGSDLELLASLVEGKSITSKEKLLKNAKVYKELSGALLKVPTPQELSDDHLSLANNYYSIGKSVERMSMFSEDPLASLMALQKYMAFTDENNVILKSINTVLRNKLTN